jgi:hypothetical protein
LLPYSLDEVSIRDDLRTAEDVVRRVEDGRLILDPEFQRGFVWSGDKQSRLIESILARVPLPAFYVAEGSTGRLIAVDGGQRLTTIVRFIADALELSLPDRSELHGRRFTAIAPRFQNRVLDCPLRFHIIEYSAPERARFDILARVKGGELLTRQQMRNAIYSGPATAFLKEESTTDAFLAATGGALDSLKMQAQALVNRFCSFSLFPLEEYQGDMDEWLARGLKWLNAAAEAEIAELRASLRLTLRNNHTVFSEHAFRQQSQSRPGQSQLNAALFDVMSTGLARYDEHTAAVHAAQLRQALALRMDGPDFNRSLCSPVDSANAVGERFELAAQMFNEVFGAR